MIWNVNVADIKNTLSDVVAIKKMGCDPPVSSHVAGWKIPERPSHGGFIIAGRIIEPSHGTFLQQATFGDRRVQLIVGIVPLVI